MIKIKGISKSYSTQSNSQKVLDAVSFEMPDNSFTTIFGPNGCGKTTLINIIAGLDIDFSGTIVGLESCKNRIGYVFQDYRRSLLPWLSVKDNILFPLALQKLGKKTMSLRLEQLLSTIAIDIDLNQKVYSLSGGQAQAVCILRALIINPKLLILDEPFAALDYERTIFLRKFLSDIAKLMKLTVLFISHDLEEAITLGDQVIFLSKRPACVSKILKVDLAYPRTPELTTTTHFNHLRENALEIFQANLINNDYKKSNAKQQLSTSKTATLFLDA